MKVYDMHVHLPIEGTFPDIYQEGIARTISLQMKIQRNVEMATRDMLHLSALMWDPDGEKMLKAMDTAGIEKAVLFSADFGQKIGDPPIHPFETNRIYADIARAHPDRYIALCAVDPRRPGALEHYRQCVEDWGMRGLKLHPSAGFLPTDKVLDPFYEKSAEWDLPIVIHCGTQIAAPVNFDEQRPVFIAEAAARHPDTTFVIAHVGMDLHLEAIMYGKTIPNLYFDLSTHQWSFISWGKDRFYQWLRQLINDIGAFRIMWATDSPLPNNFMAQDLWVKVFTKAETGIKFTKEELEMIMHGTAARIFKI
jgi:uncharacterized protein